MVTRLRKGRVADRLNVVCRILLAGAWITVLGAVALAFAFSRFTLNTTASLPRGLYFLKLGAIAIRGDLVTFPVPQTLRPMVAARDYLPSSYHLLKRIVAVQGDHVCLDGGQFLVNHHQISSIATLDSASRSLPAPFPFCGVVSADTAFVATPIPSSLDSRYFGPLPISTLARAIPVWTY